MLAAGEGKRFGGDTPKPLIRVAGTTLLERCIRTLELAGMQRIVVVVGHKAERVREHLEARRLPGEIVYCPDYQRGNGVTAAAGLRVAAGRSLLVMTDHIHEPETIAQLAAQDGDFVLAVDSDPRFEDPAGATQVVVDGGRVTSIAKGSQTFNAIESGLALCDAPAIAHILQRSDTSETCEWDNCKSGWLQTGQPLLAFDVPGAFWLDVDDASERTRAERLLVSRAAHKPLDGIIARHINRPLSRRLTQLLVRTPVTPNAMSVFTFLLLLLSAALLALGATEPAALIAGGVLAQLASALDGVDGELARAGLRTSHAGEVFDAVLDRYGDLALICGLAIAADHDWSWPMALGALAANWQISFLRREHEKQFGSVPPSHTKFGMGRDVRLLVIALCSVLLQPLAALALLTGLGNLDALRRLASLFARSRRRSEERV